MRIIGNNKICNSADSPTLVKTHKKKRHFAHFGESFTTPVNLNSSLLNDGWKTIRLPFGVTLEYESRANSIFWNKLCG